MTTPIGSHRQMTARWLIVSALVCLTASGPQAQEAPAEPPAGPRVSAGPGGFSLASGEGDFELRMRFYMQPAFRFFLDEDDSRRETFFLQRARFPVSARLFQDLTAYTVIDFAGERVQLLDAYLDWEWADEIAFRFGKGKVPFGLERLQSGAALQFIDLNLPTQLVGNRDMGAFLHGDVGEGLMEYQLGVFNGVADGASGETDIDDGKDLVARLYFTPFARTEIEALSGLSIGGAVEFGDVEGTAAATGLSNPRSAGRTNIARYVVGEDDATTALADGTRLRWTAQGYYHFGPISWMAEYVQSSQELSLGDQNEELVTTAFGVTLTGMLFGGRPSFEAVRPDAAWAPAEGEFGAFELKVRVGLLEVDEDAFPTFATGASSALALGGGFNWYFSRVLRLNFEIESTAFEDINGGAVGEDELAGTAWMQISY